MKHSLRVVMAQINLNVGDIPGNAGQVAEAVKNAKARQADLVVFPELTLCGYPPEDLLLRPSMQIRVEKALAELQSLAQGIVIILGLPWLDGGKRYNAAFVLKDGAVAARYYKQCLPNYQVFDEKRYFEPATAALVMELGGVPVAVTICEDIWHEGPARQAAEAGAQLLINLNASPFHVGKMAQREALLARQASSNRLSIVYVNLVGGQDELVFDGGSMVFDPNGRCVVQAPQFEAGLYAVEFVGTRPCLPVAQPMPAPLSPVASVYQALVVGVRDYVNKNGFKSIVLGLSGGVDSALTLAVAVDALGAERCHAVMMPFTYTSQMSLEDAREEAMTLGVRYDVFSIEPMYQAFMQTLQTPFAGRAADTTEENLQARCRGVLLMSLSNKFGSLVLTTGNKSEMAVGYSTLYGDMAGGFDVLKDVPKTLVYELCQYRNAIAPCIPQRVLDRPPSAELAPGQKDQDSLPPYDELDRILFLYVENDYSADAIVAEGHERAVVERVIRLVDVNEYKRRQAPIGVRITARGFGKDRRYPITSRWKAGQ